MKLFNYLKKREVKQEETFVNLWSSLVISMEKYWRDQQQYLIPNPENIKNEMNRLDKLGLVNSKNYKILGSKYNNHSFVSEGILFLKECRRYFGETSILVRYDMFEDLLKKNNLKIGLLTSYTGVIPEKNLRELASVKEKIQSGIQYKDILYRNLGVSGIPEFEYVCFITGIKSRSDGGEKLGKKFLEAHDNRILFSNLEYRYSSYCDPKTEIYLTEKEKELLDSAHSFELEIIKTRYDILLIACPESDLNPQPLEIIREDVKDPVIFQFTKFGVLIHSVWGDETESEVIKEYSRLNSLFDLW